MLTSASLRTRILWKTRITTEEIVSPAIHVTGFSTLKEERRPASLQPEVVMSCRSNALKNKTSLGIGTWRRSIMFSPSGPLAVDVVPFVDDWFVIGRGMMFKDPLICRFYFLDSWETGTKSSPR